MGVGSFDGGGDGHVFTARVDRVLPARPSRGTPHSFARDRGARGDRCNNKMLIFRCLKIVPPLDGEIVITCDAT
jgi:hypothetical protein